jgi:hypothetical protein
MSCMYVPVFGGGGSLAVVLVPGHQGVDRLAHLLRTVAVLAGLSLTVATAHYGFTVSSCIQKVAVLCGPRIRVADPHHCNADPDPDPALRQSDANLWPLVYRPSQAPF